MTAISQSALLQALGWATLNSFWQVGLLWCGFVLIRRYGSLSPGRQFGLAVSGLGIGLLSFLLSLWFYLQPGSLKNISPLLSSVEATEWLPILLSSASVAYLILLSIPTARLVQNWRFLRRLRRSSLHKAPVQYRLFVKKVGGHLGLRRPVQVFLSGLVTSPVTIGFFKPLILLPVASFNQLTMRQAEAILLHELAHIRRFDFLINIGITITQTLLYFNPFVRLFVQAAETSREWSCDKLVLQFGYDQVAYASALLHLEKTASPQMTLAMGATGKNNFMARIQAILGIGSPRPSLKMQHFTGLLASLLCIFALHSIFISGKNNTTEADALHAFAQFANPFQLAFTENEAPAVTAAKSAVPEMKKVVVDEIVKPVSVQQPNDEVTEMVPPPPPPPDAPPFIQVAKKEAAAALSAEEQQKVEEVISTTKKVLSAYEWKQLETEMADGLTQSEKAQVRQQYQLELEKINWKRMEENLTQQYNQTNLEKVQVYLEHAQVQLKRDSLVQAYNAILCQVEAGLKQHPVVLPLPDLSTGELQKLKLDLRKKRDSLIIIQERPIIKL